MTTETLTRSEAHRKLLTLGMPVEQVIHVLDYPNDLLDPMRPALTVAASEKAVAIVAAYQRHCESKATTDPLATVPAEERARILGVVNRIPFSEHSRGCPYRRDALGTCTCEMYQGWHRNTECCEWHRTGGRVQSPCAPIMHRTTIEAPEGDASPHVIKDGKANRPGSGLYGRLTGEELQAAREAAPETRARAEMCNCGHEKVTHAAAGHGACTAVLGEDARCVCRGYSRRAPEQISPGKTPVYCGALSADAMACTRKPHTDGRHLAEGAPGDALERWTTPDERVTEDEIDEFERDASTAPDAWPNPLTRRLAAEVRALRAELDAAHAALAATGDVVVGAVSEIKRLRDAVTRTENVTIAREMHRDDASLDAVFAKWLPLLAPHLNGEQQAALRADVVSAANASRPRIPLPEAAARFTAGHVQRLRDGTWEWSPDGGFDQGVYTLSTEVGAWLTRTVNETVDASRQAPSLNREALGRIVREVWIAWAYEQAAPKPSWLVPWEGLSECDREVDRRIGERIAREALASRPGLTEEQADDVRSIRRSLGLTQEALGGKIGYRGETISRWENGHEEVPPVVLLALIGLRASRGEVAPDSAPVSTAQEKQ